MVSLGLAASAVSTAVAIIPMRPRCSRDGSGNGKNNQGEKMSMDWDKAWSSFKNRGKKSLLQQFKPDAEKYVSRNPRRSEYPLAEEVDPIKRTERSNLNPWTSSNFTVAGAAAIIALLLIYTLLFPLK